MCVPIHREFRTSLYRLLPVDTTVHQVQGVLDLAYLTSKN